MSVIYINSALRPGFYAYRRIFEKFMYAHVNAHTYTQKLKVEHRSLDPASLTPDEVLKKGFTQFPERIADHIVTVGLMLPQEVYNAITRIAFPIENAGKEKIKSRSITQN